ncbi:MAG: hypothetical protein V3V33_12475 [Candidatus Lokiarchaeia archaeon]
MPIDFSKYQNKVVSGVIKSEKKDTPKEPFSEPENISPVKNIESFENEPKTTQKDTKSEINESLELNLIKSIYANRFGSTTNKTKAHMIRKIKIAWKY